MEALAHAILESAPEYLATEIARKVPHLHHRNLALEFVTKWRNQATSLDTSTVGIALLTAAHSERAHRDSQTVELVWTGPDTGDQPLRRTEPAILQVLDAARQRITLVSFAVYRIPNIATALTRAALRGVHITVIVETPHKIEGQGEYDTIRALGPEVEACSSVYYWPQEKRPRGSTDKPGILHVKCVVADGTWLFLSSANLTQQAFSINMELGMLVRGGTMPFQVEQQFTSLIENGNLVPI